ncbi:flavodoxin family protein [Novosphingobium lubricantis]
MAEAALSAAQVEGPCRMVRAAAVQADDLLGARGYLFCMPENLGGLSGEMKEFCDRTYYPLLGRIEGRAYATIVAAGTDGTGAERQMDRVAAGWRLRRVAESLIVRNGAQTPEAILAPKTVDEQALEGCRNLGQALSGGLALGIF